MNLQKGHTYLLACGMHKVFTQETLFSVTILEITERAFHIRWNTGLTSNDTWELKDHFDDGYQLIEDISKFMDVNIEKTFYCVTKLVPCPSCGDSGSVGDNFSTAGTKLCPPLYGQQIYYRSN